MRGDAQARTHDDSSQMIVDKGVVSPLGRLVFRQKCVLECFVADECYEDETYGKSDDVSYESYNSILERVLDFVAQRQQIISHMSISICLGAKVCGVIFRPASFA